MKLLSVNLARSICLFDLREMNPRGRNIYPFLIPALVEKYKFAKFPRTIEDLNEQKGVQFQSGTFIGAEGEPVNLDFTIYNDGLVVQTRSSTIDTDAFLAEILKEAKENYKLSISPGLIRKKLYVSELIMESEASLNGLNPKLESFLSELASFLPDLGPLPFETIGIGFGLNKEGPFMPTAFRFERKENVPFSENKYYSIAPLATETHLKLLNRLEDILTDKKSDIAPPGKTGKRAITL